MAGLVLALTAAPLGAAVVESSLRPVEVPGVAVIGAPVLESLTAKGSLESRSAVAAPGVAAVGAVATPRLAAAPFAMPVHSPAVSASPTMGGLRESALEIQRAVSAGTMEQADRGLKRLLDGADKGGDDASGAGNGGSNAGGAGGGSNGDGSSGGGADRPWRDFPEPSAHLEAARQAAPKDARLIVASAIFQSQPATWRYTFRSQNSREDSEVEVDAGGRVRPGRTSRAKDDVQRPLDLSGFITLKKAVEVATGAGFEPFAVLVGNDDGRPAYVFIGTGARRFLSVDAVTGKIILDTASRSAAPASAKAAPAAAPEQLADLNRAVAEALKPFNDTLTKAKLTFSKAVLNATRAVEVELKASASVKAPDGRRSFTVKKFAYRYPEAQGSAPTVEADLALRFDPLSVLTQDQLNRLASDPAATIRELLSLDAAGLGHVQLPLARATRVERDAGGNVTRLSLSLSRDVDLGALPPGENPDRVSDVRERDTIEISRAGIDAVLRLTRNPRHPNFQQGARGLKEIIDLLLKRDEEMLFELVAWFSRLQELGASPRKGS